MWGGHVLTVFAVANLLFCLYELWSAARAFDGETIFVEFIWAVWHFLWAVIIGMIAAWKFNTAKERYHLRQMWLDEDTNYSGVPLPTGVWVSPVYEAHRADEGVIQDAVQDDDSESDRAVR